MKSDIRCLAVRQPWAWAIMTGAKDIENRSWSTDYRGRIVILASSMKTEVNQIGKAAKLPPRDFVYSALLGMVDLVDVVPMSEDLEANPWAWGPYCWRVANPRLLPEPIPAKGKLMLYALQEELAERVRLAIVDARPQENDELARRWLAHMAEPSPVDDRALGLTGTYMELGDAPNALRIAEARVARDRNADALIDRGRARFISDDYGGALTDLEEAIRMDPESARAYFMRGLVYERLALLDKEKAAELDPTFADEDEGDAADGDEEAEA
jgi:tetratricopeptide (TPR) repeat protein